MHRHIMKTLCIILVLTVATIAQAGEGKPLRIGVLPINTTRNMVKLYEPVREYLEESLHQPVVVVTAADFKTFQADAEAGDFDLIVTAAHLGRLAELDAHFVPLVRYKALHQSLLITSKAHPLHALKEIKGNVVAGIDPLTMAMSDAMSWLREQGLQAGRDYTLLITPTPVSAAYAVRNQQAILAIGSIQGMKQMPEELHNELQVYHELVKMPSLMWMAHPRLKDRAEEIRRVLLNFTPDSAEGAQFYEATGYQGMREISKEEERLVDGVANEARRLLNRK